MSDDPHMLDREGLRRARLAYRDHRPTASPERLVEEIVIGYLSASRSPRDLEAAVDAGGDALRAFVREHSRSGIMGTGFETAAREVIAAALPLVSGPVEAERPQIRREEVAAKLAEMWLHDDTGDPQDKGYMAAVREFQAWLKQEAQERGTTSGPVLPEGEKADG